MNELKNFFAICCKRSTVKPRENLPFENTLLAGFVGNLLSEGANISCNKLGGIGGGNGLKMKMKVEMRNEESR